MADSKDKPLESYIHLSYHLGANCFTRDKRIFDHGLSHMPPFLRSSRKNRLLLYPGSFNPPHYGHLNLLCDAFQRSQYDIIAAIVLPLDDDRLEKKCGEQRKEMVLSKKQRVDLWRGEHWPNDWFWVYDRTESEWNRFRRVLTENITRDGFELDFVLLCGPDYVQTHSLPPPMPWGCRDIIVSDAGRPADFNRMVALDTLENCGPWKVITLSDDAGLQNAQKQINWVINGLWMLSPKTMRARLSEDPNYIEALSKRIYDEVVSDTSMVMVCNRTDVPESTIRFVPKKKEHANISSTMIRDIIRNNPAREIGRKLSGLALNSDTLAGFVVQADSR